MIVKIRSTQLTIGMFIHRLDCSWLRHPFLQNRFLLTDVSDIRKIISSGISDVWIDDEKGTPALAEPPARADCFSALDRADELTASASLDPPKSDVRYAMELCRSARAEVERLFHDVRLGRILETGGAGRMVDEITESIARRPEALLSVVQLKTHDNYTYMHSVAVCALMVALAQQMRLTKEDIRNAGIAGFFHDIGKATISSEILAKPGKLTEIEFNKIKDHPSSGASILSRSGTAMRVLDVALHHHEKWDGSGYPHGLRGDEISLFARMGAVCDVYDAITSARSYKSAWSPAYALRKMISWKGHFDPTILSEFVNAIGLYPVGSIVELSSNRLARVVKVNKLDFEKPQVEVFYSLLDNCVTPLEKLDLSHEANAVQIVGVHQRTAGEIII